MRGDVPPITSSQIPARRRLAFLFVFVGMMVLALEAGSYLVWAKILKAPAILQAYQERKATIGKLLYDTNVRLALPYRDTTYVNFSAEFIQETRSTAHPALRGGLLGERAHAGARRTALVLGDSFTWGVGSIDNFRHNWVDQLARAFPDVDFVNLASPVTIGQIQQRLYYNRIAEAIEHDFVIVSISTASDYQDNFRPTNILPYFEKAPDLAAAERNWSRYQTALSYDQGCEDLLRLRLSVHTFLVANKIIRSVFPGGPAWLRNMFPVCPGDAAYTVPVPSDIHTARAEFQALSALLLDPALLTFEMPHPTNEPRLVLRSGFEFRFFPIETESQFAEVTARNTAQQINGLFDSVRAKGKRLIVVVHPSKVHLYFEKDTPDRPTWNVRFLFRLLRNMMGTEDDEGTAASREAINHPGRVTDLMKKSLDSAIDVIDIRDDMQQRASSATGRFFWPFDAHYTPLGYGHAARAVCNRLNRILPGALDERQARCAFSDTTLDEALALTARGLAPTR